MKKTPWWLWLNVLGLDAPLIAIIWQRFLVQSWHLHMKIWPTIVLGLGVWTIYLIDRCCDSYSSDSTKMRERHLFARANRLWMWPLAFICGILSLWLALTKLLWEREFVVGISGVVMVAYLLLWHRLKSRRMEKSYLKEIMVGLIFAAGVAGMAGLTQRGMLELFETLMFGLVCALNCIVIRWIEGPLPERKWKWLAVTEVIMGSLFLSLGRFLGDRELVLAALAGALFGLAFLKVFIKKMDVRLARVLADVALLTPLVAWLVKVL